MLCTKIFHEGFGLMLIEKPANTLISLLVVKSTKKRSKAMEQNRKSDNQHCGDKLIEVLQRNDSV
nr:hypothetical protein [Elizabethkingia sp. ASV34]